MDINVLEEEILEVAYYYVDVLSGWSDNLLQCFVNLVALFQIIDAIDGTHVDTTIVFVGKSRGSGSIQFFGMLGTISHEEFGQLLF